MNINLGLHNGNNPGTLTFSLDYTKFRATVDIDVIRILISIHIHIEHIEMYKSFNQYELNGYFVL